MKKIILVTMLLITSIAQAHSESCDVRDTSGDTECAEIYLLPSAIFEKAMTCIDGFWGASAVSIDTQSQTLSFRDFDFPTTTVFSYETCGEEVYFTKSE